jgi:hypothetical protein
MTVFGAGFAATSEHFRESRNPSIVVNRRTRTQSVQNRIVSETPLVSLSRTGFREVGTPIQARRVLRWAHEGERPMILSSTTRKQGQRGCRPFPLHLQSPPSRRPPPRLLEPALSPCQH